MGGLFMRDNWDGIMTACGYEVMKLLRSYLLLVE